LVALRHDRVSDIVDRVFVTLDENTLVAEAARILYKQERRTIVVTHFNSTTGKRVPIGIVTERDFIFRVVAQNRGPFKTELKDIMSAPVVTIDVDKSVGEAMTILNEHQINRLPVIQDGSIIGIVTTERILGNVPIEKHA
jgi:CBS domain-containing protein